MIQSLVHTVELGRDRILLLETFRIKRNAIDCTGDDIDEASVDECIEAVEHLLQWVTRWLLDNKPDLAE
ncbi:MAG TPA: hypothetical protein PKK10_10325 [Woeseiaceae bacterium]|nr:hypothetical protein [Woeseiaceae bacterium]